MVTGKKLEHKELFQRLLKEASYIDELDENFLEKAYDFALAAHKGQKRVSGEDFVLHPLRAALILTKLKVDQETLVAAMLHDILEDTEVSSEDLEAEFGKTVTKLVVGVTKLNKLRINEDAAERQIESLRKMFLVMAKDLRVLLIKLADCLHNMYTLDVFSADKRKRIARKTIEIYAPLADRLGVWEIKWQLEDQAFKYILPSKYKSLAESLQASHKEREAYVKKVQRILRKKASKGRIDLRIEGRTKNLYSIYKKMQRKNKDLSEIYDIFALRIIVSSVQDCYAVLGIVHDTWKPKPGRFKDYIAMPKGNGYQSLHTTVFCVDGRLTEFQIRTEKMHEEAEHGISSHWYYKEKGSSKFTPEKQLGWVKKIVELQESFKDGDEFLEDLRMDVFKDRIFAFTPKGDVKDLPKGATCVDFAYSIHTALGHGMKGVKVNGVMLPIHTVLETGDMVEILADKNPKGPKRDWLNFVVTSNAKNKIRAWFKAEDREANLKVGYDLLNAKLAQLEEDLTLQKISKDRIEAAVKKLPYEDFESALVAIGEGFLTASQALKKIYTRDELLNKMGKQKKTVKRKLIGRPEILVEGEKNLMTRIASCCNPGARDKIVGYTTRGKGISIHKEGCSSLKRLDPERILHADWAGESQDKRFEVKIRVCGSDRLGIFRDLAAVISELDINIARSQANLEGKNKKNFSSNFILELKNFEELEKVIAKLERVPGVEKVKRI